MLARKEANAIKITSVAVGLLVSTLVFSRLGYNYSFDRCFPDRDNLYQIWMEYEQNGEHAGPYRNCPGKIGVGVEEAFGEDLVATTVMFRMSTPPLFEGDRRIDVKVTGVDSTFFKTFGIPVISGNPAQDMTVPNVVYLSEKTAKEIFGSEEPIGRTLSFNQDISLTVKGLFPDIDGKTTVPGFKALVSWPTFMAMGYDRQIHWSGGDMWPCYFRIKSDAGLDREQINRRLNAMYQTHVPDTETEATLLVARPISETYFQNDSVRRMNMVLWILGFALLLITSFNYVLITIASLSRRAKSIGVHKCSGAGSGTIIGMFITETAIVLLCAVAVMTVLVFLFKPFIEDVLSVPFSEIFEPSRLWIIVAVLGFFFLVGGMIPGWIFSRIPVTQIFRRFTEKNSRWKRSLLFVQIAGVTFISALLVIVSVQYREVLTRDMGFSYDRVASFKIPNKIDGDALRSAVSALPYVEKIAASWNNPLWDYSGNNIRDESDNLKFNTRWSMSEKGFADVMGMTLLEGREPEKDDEAIVNEEFSKRMGWGSHPVGETLPAQSMGKPLRVVGLVKNFQIKGFTNEIRPYIGLSLGFDDRAYVKVKEPFDRNYSALGVFLEEMWPSYDFSLIRLDKEATALYKDVRMFRNSAIISVVALIFISFMGLIGFTRDEVQRRSKEIAIRKVNGAGISDILRLLVADVACIAIPAVLAGVICAVYVGNLWLRNFTIEAPFIGVWYALASVTVIILVGVCVISVSLSVARENPVLRLKSE